MPKADKLYDYFKSLRDTALQNSSQIQQNGMTTFGGFILMLFYVSFSDLPLVQIRKRTHMARWFARPPGAAIKCEACHSRRLGVLNWGVLPVHNRQTLKSSSFLPPTHASVSFSHPSILTSVMLPHQKQCRGEREISSFLGPENSTKHPCPCKQNG